MEKTKGAVWNDLELYFYLYRDKLEWELAVAPTYLTRARTDRIDFQAILEDYCIDHNIHIYNRKINKRGAMVFYMGIENRSTLKPKNGVYDTPMTTKRQ